MAYIDPGIINFIEKNKEILNNNDFNNLYALTMVEDIDVGELTELLLSVGINPLFYTDRVPPYYLTSTDIEEFKIPDNGKINAIGDHAFQYCQMLKKIDIPKSVLYIGYQAFDGCASLKEVDLSGITEIYSSAFRDCASLENIIFGNKIKIIKNGAFYGCNRLTSINIPGSIKLIDEYSFYCKNLTDITINNGVQYIENKEFPNVQEIKFNGTADQWRNIYKSYKVADVVHCIDGSIKFGKDKWGRGNYAS